MHTYIFTGTFYSIFDGKIYTKVINYGGNNVSSATVAKTRFVGMDPIAFFG